MEKTVLVQLYRHDGLCRVYFRQKGTKNRYCLQDAISGPPELFKCSQDGEPSHRVSREAYTLEPLLD